MTIQVNNLLLASGRASSRPGNHYDASTRDLVDNIYRGLDGGLGASSGGDSRAAARRAARAAFARKLKTPGAMFGPEERRLLEGGNAQVLNLAEGTGSAGGFLVPALLFPQISDRLKFYGAVASVARVIETDTGAALNVATTDDTANPATLLAESALSPSVDLAFGQVTLSSYKFTSGIAPASFEIARDSGIDLATIILDLFGKRLGRGQNTFFTTGTGTAQPQGVVTGATLGFQLPGGNTTSLTYAGLVQLYQSVDPAYRANPNCAWMMNDATLLSIKLMTDGVRPLWLPDVIPQLPGSVFHGTLLGKPVVVNPSMANMAASAKCVLFGDFAQYAIRQVRGAAMMQLNDSAYAASGQTAFIMFTRADGRVLQPQAIKYLQNSAT
ncbi:MAG: phage major capsid protein [Beijerinckiaceae bacterium]